MIATTRALTALLLASAALPAAAEELKFMAALSGEAQVPPVETEAVGMADITVDTESMTLRWQMVYDGLTGEPVAAHFHAPAGPEETAPPVLDMVADLMGDEVTDEPLPTDIMAGSAELTEEGLAALQDGMMYINIHTEQYPDGEIRGQVVEGEADTEMMEAMGGDAPDDGTGAEAMEDESTDDIEEGDDAGAAAEADADADAADADVGADVDADAADAEADAGADADADADATEAEDGEEAESN